MLTHEEQEKIIGGLLKLKENSLCADCNSKMPCCSFAVTKGPLSILEFSSA